MCEQKFEIKAGRQFIKFNWTRSVDDGSASFRRKLFLNYTKSNEHESGVHFAEISFPNWLALLGVLFIGALKIK